MSRKTLECLLAALLLTLAGVAAAQPPAAVTVPEVEPLFYSVRVNGQATGDALLLRQGERLLARESDWDRWHLKHPDTGAYSFEGDNYYALAQAEGFRATLNAQRQEASFEFAPRAFLPSVFDASARQRVAPQPPPGLGGFLNYEAFGTHVAPEQAPASSNLNGQVEAGVFNARGVGTSQWLGLNLTDESAATTGSERRIVRLETAWTRDFPDSMQTLRLGDGTGAGGLWGRPVRSGGVRWTRNFATQPGFITLPQPALSGETALPSVLDIYVDGLRRQRLDLPPGPFTVQNLPTYTGQGEVQVVVRDLLGREQLISDSYIAGVSQLREGLHDYSYEAGFERQRFGLVSDDYGRFIAAGTHRYGFSDRLTGEGRVEIIGSDAQVAGVGAIMALPELAVISNAVAVSHDDPGFGALDIFTLQRSTRRGLTLGGQLQLASRKFVQAGLAQGVPPPKRTLSANLGYRVQALGRFGLSYINRRTYVPGADIEAVTGMFATGIRGASLSLLVVRQLAPQDDVSAGLTLAVPFGVQDIGTAGYRHTETDAGAGSSQSYAGVQRSLPLQEGWGYRALVRQDDTETGSTTEGEAGVGVNARYGSLGLEAATTEGSDTYRATIAGGLGTLGGHVFASRKISSSFAVVETGAPGIDLLVNNRLAGRTDSSGVAVLPYLQPYQDNTVRIDATNVPLDIEVHTGEFKAAPYYRSGVLIPLDVRQIHSALAVLRQDDGAMVPAGAVARLRASGAEFPVGRRGEVYLTGLQTGDNAIDVSWNGSRCSAVVGLAPDAGVQPQLGPVQCVVTP